MLSSKIDAMKSIGFILLLSVEIKFAFSTTDLLNSLYLDREKSYQLNWQYNTGNQSITVEMTVPSVTGWVAVGFSPDGKMSNGSDVVIAWVNEKGKVFVKDGYVNKGHVQPSVDEDQDWVVVYGAEDKGTTTVRLRRNICTFDYLKDSKIEKTAMHVIFAYGRFDPDDDVYSKILTHQWQGSRLVYLRDPPQPFFNPYQDNLQSIDVTIDSVQYEGKQLVVCRILKISDFANIASKHHIIKAEPILNSTAPSRLTLYQCSALPPSLSVDRGFCADTYLSVGGVTEYTNQILSKYRETYCTDVIASFGPGSRDFILPDDAGISIGDSKDHKFFLLEVYYPSGEIKGTVDNSGIRLYLTSSLRKYDAGVIQVGATPTKNMVIPPHYGDGFMIEGHCTQPCFAKGFEGVNFEGDQEVTVFSATMVTHDSAKSAILRHVRNNYEGTDTVQVEMPFIFKDVEFKPRLQTWRPLTNTKLKTSDRMIAECIFSKQNNLTLGGLYEEDETCFGLIAYYPKLKLSRCMTASEKAGLVKVNVPFATKDQIYSNGGYYNALMYGADWRYVGIQNKFQHLSLRNDAVVVCSDSDANQFVMNRMMTQYTAISQNYTEPNDVTCRVVVQPNPSPPIDTSRAISTGSSWTILIFAVTVNYINV